jgi:soluble P-type ATPase
VVQKEGASAEAIAAADVVARDVRDALDLLAQPRRLLATLRD